MTVGAMKMAVHITAPYDGVIDEISVKANEKIDQGTLVAIMSPTPETDVVSLKKSASFAT